MSLLVEDQDIISELLEQEDDRDRVRLMTAELFCKAVAVEHMAQQQETEMSFMEAYTSCTMELLRNAFEDTEGAAYVFYDCLEDTCPKCANMYLGLMGLVMERDIHEHIEMVTNYTSRYEVEMEAEAVAFVARHTARVLLGIKMQDVTMECLEGCTDNNRTIESMRTNNSSGNDPNQN